MIFLLKLIIRDIHHTPYNRSAGSVLFSSDETIKRKKNRSKQQELYNLEERPTKEKGKRKED